MVVMRSDVQTVTTHYPELTFPEYDELHLISLEVTFSDLLVK